MVRAGKRGAGAFERGAGLHEDTTSYLSTLAETEDREAELIPTGLTNREVVARLFLTVSTVESNLRRA